MRPSVLGFSFRQDLRKASGAVIRFQLAEEVREETASGKNVGSKRRRELKELITTRLTAKVADLVEELAKA